MGCRLQISSPLSSIERIGLAYMVVYYAVRFAVYRFCHRYKAFEHPLRGRTLLYPQQVLPSVQSLRTPTSLVHLLVLPPFLFRAKVRFLSRIY